MIQFDVLISEAQTMRKKMERKKLKLAQQKRE